MKPIDYAIAAVETMMRRYEASELPPKPQFHYHQGVFLSGVNETYKLCGDKRYIEYIKGWVDSVFDENGVQLYFHEKTLDDIQPGILLFILYDYTGDDYYLKCLANVYRELEKVPVNAEGGYWHGGDTEDQMWLDGLYMGGPFSAEYAKRFDKPELAANVVHQALLMRRNTIDEKTGLMYHAWDGARKTPWADPETGRSAEFWGRSMGWIPVAMLNDLDFLPENVPGREEFIRMMTGLLTALCKYQGPDGRWYQVVDKVDRPENWPENSCSCLFVAGLCKAMRKGYLPASFAEAARRGYEGVIRSLGWKGEDLQIGNVCIGTGVGDYQHYINRPTSVNDLHGVGAFLIMCTEMQKWLDQQG